MNYANTIGFTLGWILQTRNRSGHVHGDETIKTWELGLYIILPTHTYTYTYIYIHMHTTKIALSLSLSIHIFHNIVCCMATQGGQGGYGLTRLNERSAFKPLAVLGSQWGDFVFNQTSVGLTRMKRSPRLTQGFTRTPNPKLEHFIRVNPTDVLLIRKKPSLGPQNGKWLKRASFILETRNRSGPVHGEETMWARANPLYGLGLTLNP